MARDDRRADAELLAGRCRELAEFTRYSGFDLAAHILSVAHEELLKQQQRHIPPKKAAGKKQ